VAGRATEITFSVGSSHARLDSLCRVAGTSPWAGVFKGQPSSTLRGPARRLERDYLQGHGVIWQGVAALNWKKVDLG